MGKYIGAGSVTEHKGLAKLKTFCANNIPFLVCRDETILDVGIDGEIEISMKNEDGKIEATGERIKFQLKSTESDNSYIQEETNDEFKFYAQKNDVEYWSKHKQDVLLIIYDGRNDKLYGKKITYHDYKSQSQSKVRYPIYFNKIDCLLDTNNFDFHKKYSTSIKQRLNFDLKETAMTNVFKVRKFPKNLYCYETNFTNKESVFKFLGKDTHLPEFLIYDKTIYTFVSIHQDDSLKSIVSNNTEKEIINFNYISISKNNRNHYVELIRLYMKKYFGSKGVFFNKNYNRFYFSIRKEEAVRSIFTTTRKQGRKSPKEVAKFYKYGKYEFYRHFAFEVDFLHAESMYICITPTYLITSDGKNPVDGKMASKFIIPQKSREFNPNVANSIHTIFSFFSTQEGDSIIINNDDNLVIELSCYVPLLLPFSISNDDKGFPEYLKRQRKLKEKESIKTLF